MNRKLLQKSTSLLFHGVRRRVGCYGAERLRKAAPGYFLEEEERIKKARNVVPLRAFLYAIVILPYLSSPRPDGLYNSRIPGMHGEAVSRHGTGGMQPVPDRRWCNGPLCSCVCWPWKFYLSGRPWLLALLSGSLRHSREAGRRLFLIQ